MNHLRSWKIRAFIFSARPINISYHLAMPWSMGKNSAVLLWLARKGDKKGSGVCVLRTQSSM
jgi:3'-phosphoadenosine 5'-phosphosulfate sulfotransferase (PAPS reductase)/FAD synthetase